MSDPRSEIDGPSGLRVANQTPQRPAFAPQLCVGGRAFGDGDVMDCGAPDCGCTHEPVKVGPGRYTYRGWRIDHDPPPIGYRGADWQFVHPDYDLDDPRHGHAASLEAACAEIDNYETDGEF